MGIDVGQPDRPAGLVTHNADSAYGTVQPVVGLNKLIRVKY
jgi:hypothetical protein